MADPVIGDFRAFAAQQRDRLATRGIDITPYRLSHLGFRRCRSGAGMPSELRICVPLVPIVSRRFPFLHGDETGTAHPPAFSFSA
jgi:hypothetical protein